jgi:hypothetical protein
MPSKSVKQQRFFGATLAYKRGKMRGASKAIKTAARSMSEKEIEDFASTKLKGLPRKARLSKSNRRRIR